MLSLWRWCASGVRIATEFQLPPKVVARSLCFRFRTCLKATALFRRLLLVLLLVELVLVLVVLVLVELVVLVVSVVSVVLVLKVS
jgi:hypothetical protein